MKPFTKSDLVCTASQYRSIKRYVESCILTYVNYYVSVRNDIDSTPVFREYKIDRHIIQLRRHPCIPLLSLQRIINQSEYNFSRELVRSAWSAVKDIPLDKA